MDKEELERSSIIHKKVNEIAQILSDREEVRYEILNNALNDLDYFNMALINLHRFDDIIFKNKGEKDESQNNKE